MARDSAFGLQPLFAVDWTDLSFVGPRLPYSHLIIVSHVARKNVAYPRLALSESCGLMCAPFPQLLLIALGLAPSCLLAIAADPLTMVLPQWLGAVPSGCNRYLLWTRPG